MSAVADCELPQVEQLLIDFIRHELVRHAEPAPLSPDENLIAAGVIDSLGILRLIKFIYDRFAIVIEAQDVALDNFRSVHRIARLLQSRNPHFDAATGVRS